MEVASENFDAACAHGALAAVLGVPVCRVMKHFGKGGWVNIPDMKKAISAAGRNYYRRKHEGQDLLPGPEEIAVMMIQFTGPWMQADNVYAACRHRHWIAAWGNGLYFDANQDEWIRPVDWRHFLLPRLLPARGDKGWFFQAVLFIDLPAAAP